MQTTTHCNRTNLTIILILAGLAALLALPAEQARAQTPVTKIEDSAGDSVFVSYDDGALLGLGEYNTGVIPASGAGTRMMWHPAKAAFRAGEVDGTQWDDANIGHHSVAMGDRTTASNNGSVAMGSLTTASGFGSFAMGYNTTSSKSQSVSMGYETTASGHQSVSMGDNTTAATDHSLSIGAYNNTNTSADNTLFVAGNGTNPASGGSRSDALVLNKDAGLVVNGEQGTGVIPASGAGTRMMWYPAKAAFRAGDVDGTQWDDANIGNYSVAMGQNTTGGGDHSVAMGYGTTASHSKSTAMGASTTASNSNATAMGFNTTASGHTSTAMGWGTTAATDASLSIGEYNSANTSADATLFVVGNGTSTTPSDALVLDDTGDMTIAGTLTESSDRRLKKNISPLGDGILGKLGTISPRKFQFKNQQTHPDGKQIGLIAQEVQQQFPELVSEAGNGYLSVSYSKFTAVLLKGLQEQQQEIQTLKDENKNIKKRLAKLEQQNSRTAGMPLSTLGVLLLGIVIGSALWWRARGNDQKS